jgi:hypothetical protein
VLSVRVAVRSARPPIVIRTQPPPDRLDVPVNASIIVVFSEPMNAGSITPSSIRLRQGTATVSGTVRFLDVTQTAVEFVPSTPLAATTQYELTVTDQVRDLAGDAMQDPVTVTFTTGSSTTGAPASLRLSPDVTLGLLNGTTYPLTATVRDAAGTVLTTQPVSWVSSDASGLAVSTRGLLTAQRVGSYQITASAGALSRTLSVIVSPPAADSIVLSPTSATVQVGAYTDFYATVWDETGRIIVGASVTCASSATAVATVASADSASNIIGRVRGVSPGSAISSATSGTASKTASVTVIP